MKTTTAFNILHTNRRNRRRAQVRFVAVSLKKDGTPRKVMPCDLDDGFATREEAEAKAAQMEKLNPGRRFAVVEAGR